MMRGMVLAAGFGTRLLPLTELLPKPMFPACNMPLIDFALKRLETVGIEEVVVNLHHLPDPIHQYLADGSRFEQRITFSEEPRILGTGGGIKAVREWIGGNPFCVTNGDTVVLANLEAVVEDHLESGALATLALTPSMRPDRFSTVSVDDEGKIIDIAGRLGREGDFLQGIFIGFSIFEPEIFDIMPDRDHFCIVQDVLLPLIRTDPGSVHARFVEGTFFDMGTPEDYLKGNIELLIRHINEDSLLVRGKRHLGDNVFIGDNVRLGRGVNLSGPCIIGDDVRIEGGSEIGPATVVGDGAYLGAWTRLYGCVAWPGALLPGGGLHTNTILYEREILPVKEPGE